MRILGRQRQDTIGQLEQRHNGHHVAGDHGPEPRQHAAFIASLGMNCVRIPPESPWMTRTAAVRAKKKAVAADHWGMTTDGMRDVLEPLMARFTREFPAFDPYPFGDRRYAEQLVLNICFAEPLSDEFAASFAAASDDELAALGAGFAFGGCVRDDRLCQVVARSAHHMKDDDRREGSYP